jgi:hypothetical protein
MRLGVGNRLAGASQGRAAATATLLRRRILPDRLDSASLASRSAVLVRNATPCLAVGKAADRVVTRLSPQLREPGVPPGPRWVRAPVRPGRIPAARRAPEGSAAVRATRVERRAHHRGDSASRRGVARRPRHGPRSVGPRPQPMQGPSRPLEEGRDVSIPTNGEDGLRAPGAGLLPLPRCRQRCTFPARTVDRDVRN